jgi:protein-L-isoaspartate O-methyltransferase
VSNAENYIGTELELFATAHNWKAYLATQIEPHLGSRVLEVGAGLGSSTAALMVGRAERWLCLEPDARLASSLRRAIARGTLPAICEVENATLARLDAGLRFDTILYIDVLEHIPDDREEVLIASQRLNPGGKLVVLAPAHPWLFSPFDRAVGHYRRYTKRTLEAVMPQALTRIECKYLDSVGLLASASNRFVARQSKPKPSQIKLWDGYMVPLSRSLDGLLRYSIGKSVLGIWQRA